MRSYRAPPIRGPCRPRKGRLRSKIPALKETLEGRFDHLHAAWIGSIRAHVDFLDEQISGLTDAIGEQIAPFTQAVDLLCTIPGVQRRTAALIKDEIGVDSSVSRPTTACVLGREVHRHRPVRQKAPLRNDPQRLEVVGLGAGGSRDGCGSDQRRLPRRSIRKPASQPRSQESPRGRQALDPNRVLAHALNRRDLPRPRRRLLPQTRPRTRHKTARRPTPSPGHHVILEQLPQAA